MTLHQYIETINQRFRFGNATEHTFRGDLQPLLESLVPEVEWNFYIGGYQPAQK
jgi:hypothetical protein